MKKYKTPQDYRSQKDYILSECFNKSNRLIPHCKNKRFWEIRNSLEIYETLLKFQFEDFTENLYWFLNGIKERPICKVCGGDVKFTRLKDGYNDFCSQSCSSTGSSLKRKLTNLRRYGYEHVMQNPEKLKEREERQGRASTYQNHITNYEFYYKKDFIQKEFFLDGKFLLDRFMKFFNVSQSGANNHLKNLEIIYNKKSKNKSAGELEVLEFVKSIYDGEVKSGVRILDKDEKHKKGKEVDIYIPGLNLGIEYNGNYTHQFDKVGSDYHKNKTDLSEKIDINLIQIFENEWIQNKPIWKSVIANKIGINHRIYARKCSIKEISSKDSKTFLDNNHIQRNTNAKVKLGLFHGEDLMSVMTFSKSRYNKKIEWELIRFSSLKGVTVVGGASKLLKYFELNYKPKSIISYANRRWSDGNLYDKLGFSFSHFTKPNYFYFHNNNGELESRQKYMKHKLRSLDNYSDNKTEYEIMKENGFMKIYDSGNRVYIKTF